MALIFTENAIAQSENPLVLLSQSFVSAAKKGSATAEYVERLRLLPTESLGDFLVNDESKKAFWINIYNGFIIDKLNTDSTQYKKRNRFFTMRNIVIAGTTFSFDDIEHGILRRSKIKWSLGYLNKIFPSRREKNLRVLELDYRIHFALNCGAKSCPPIASYNDIDINKQLDIATKNYLQTEVRYDSTKQVLYLPKIFQWFKGDFGGRRKVLQIVRQAQPAITATKVSVRYLSYDWSIALGR